MDMTKKRRADESGAAIADVSAAVTPQSITPEDARKIIEPLADHQVLLILQDAVVRHPDVLAAVRAAVDPDPIHRRLFIRGVAPDTTTDSLRSLFSSYGEIEEAVLVIDKATGKSRGYGFVIFKHVDGAVLALREPSKRIDGRMTVTQLASAGSVGLNSDDVAPRKIFVGNIPMEISAERLLDFFLMFGEIEEGPIGLDKHAGKPKGFAFFVYRTEEGAKACLVEPAKNIDGHRVICKLAADGKKERGIAPGAGVVAGTGERLGGIGAPSLLHGLLNQQFGGSAYPGYGPGTHQGPGIVNSSLPTPTGVSNVGTQGLVRGARGYGSGPFMGGSHFGRPGSVDYARIMPPISMGMPGAAGFPGSGPYAYGFGGPQSQHLPASRPLQGPTGAMHQRFPPYH